MIDLEKFLTESKNWNEETDTNDSLHNEFHSHYSSVAHPDNKEAISDYTISSMRINGALWRNHKGEKNPNDNRVIKEKTPHLDNILDSHRTPKAFHVYSGTKGNPTEKLNSEGILHHPAYLSTSLNRRIATNFADRGRNLNKDTSGKILGATAHLLDIHVPEGHPGAYVDGASEINGEKEFVLPRGTNLKHTKTEIHKGISDFMHDGSKLRVDAHVHHFEVLPRDK